MRRIQKILGLMLASFLVVLAIFAVQPTGGRAAAALIGPVYVHLPPSATRGAHMQVVVAFHGIDGEGPEFGGQLVEQADRNDWVIVAPTLNYGNWWNLDDLVREDTNISQWLVGYLDGMEREVGIVPNNRVLVFGFSRGAGVVSRFGILHPERVLAAAAMSSGTFTLPMPRSTTGRPLLFPFGVFDLAAHTGRAMDARAFASTRWFVGVGAADDQPTDVPQTWTHSSGPTRLERAKSFSTAIRAAGAEATLRIYPDTRHFLTPDMRNDALSFLRDVEAPRTAVTAPAPAPVASNAPTSMRGSAPAVGPGPGVRAQSAPAAVRTGRSSVTAPDRPPAGTSTQTSASGPVTQVTNTTGPQPVNTSPSSQPVNGGTAPAPGGASGTGWATTQSAPPAAGTAPAPAATNATANPAPAPAAGPASGSVAQPQAPPPASEPAAAPPPQPNPPAASPPPVDPGVDMPIDPGLPPMASDDASQVDASY